MPTVTSQGLFDSLARSLRDRPDLQIALTAHVRSMSGYNTLFAFQQSDTEEDKKQAVWRWCLGALVNNCVPDPAPKPVGKTLCEVFTSEQAMKQFEGVE